MSFMTNFSLLIEDLPFPAPPLPPGHYPSLETPNVSRPDHDDDRDHGAFDGSELADFQPLSPTWVREVLAHIDDPPASSSADAEKPVDSPASTMMPPPPENPEQVRPKEQPARTDDPPSTDSPVSETMPPPPSPLVVKPRRVLRTPREPRRKQMFRNEPGESKAVDLSIKELPQTLGEKKTGDSPESSVRELPQPLGEKKTGESTRPSVAEPRGSGRSLPVESSAKPSTREPRRSSLIKPKESRTGPSVKEPSSSGEKKPISGPSRRAADKLQTHSPFNWNKFRIPRRGDLREHAKEPEEPVRPSRDRTPKLKSVVFVDQKTLNRNRLKRASTPVDWNKFKRPRRYQRDETVLLYLYADPEEVREFEREYLRDR